MKILAHLNALEPLGGVELCVLEDATALSQRGHRVDVAYGEDGSLRADYEGLGTRLGGPFGFSIDLRRPWRMATGYPPAARWARSQGDEVLWLNRFEHILWGQTVSRIARIPLVCTLHEVPFRSGLARLGAGVHRFTAVSEHVRSAWIADGLAPSRITTIPNAVSARTYPGTTSEEQQRSRRDLGLPLEGPVVLCYGRMIPEKGVGDLLTAWRRYRELRTGSGRAAGTLVLLGDPDPRGLPEAAGLDGPELRWFPSTRDVRPHLRAADVVVFPTRMDEAFGRVVAEGMAAGRPVLATSSGAVPELLAGGFEQHLVPVGDSAALAERLAHLVDWPTLDAGLGSRCRAWILSRYPHERHVDDLEAVLSGAVRRSRFGRRGAARGAAFAPGG